jgi:intracellular septation protein A
VDFKLFGILGLTLGFVLLQSIYLMRHVKPGEDSDKGKAE